MLVSVLKEPALGQFVRSLSFRSSGIKGRMYSDNEGKRQLEECMRVVKQLFTLKASPDDIDLYSCLRLWNVWFQLALLVLLLPSLRSIKLFIEAPHLSGIDLWVNRIEDPFNDSTQSIPYLISSRLEHLQEFSLIVEDPEDGNSLDSRVLDFPFLLPSLKTVYFGTAFANDASMNDVNPPPEKYWRASPVTSLTIEQSLVGIENLRELLEFPKALESFAFSYGGTSNNLSTVEAVEICQALLPHRTSLKRLEIRGYHDSREEKQEPVGSVITEFPVLEEVSIPVALLLRTELLSAFPQSVVKLRLYLYDEWSLQTCEIQVHRLLDRKRNGLVYLHLKEIWIEYWYSADDNQTISDDKWPEKRNKMMEGMVSFGKEVGVKLEFDVDETSRSYIWD